MPRIILLAYLCVMTSIYAINRPVYKIVLTQKGYTQFLQYDVETPPLREFTFCTWIRVYDLTNEQTIFTYIVNGNNRIMRLSLDSGGNNMRLSIREKVKSNFSVSVVKDVWRHICLSYQSDYGAWALYIDSRLVSCETAQSLYGFVLPGGGSVIIGYGSDNNGVSNGFEGEIFGTNMILTSTIEKNFTIKKNPRFEQKLFSKNKVRQMSGNNMEYIVLNDLQTETSKNNYEAPFNNGAKEYAFPTTNDFINQVIGIDVESTTNRESKEQLIDFDLINLNYPHRESVQFDLWKSLNSSFYPPAQTTQSVVQKHQVNINSSGTQILPLYETPPPNNSKSFFDNSVTDTPKLEFSYKLQENTPFTKMKSPLSSSEISDIETPPPIQQSSKVYGQWTSSKFAGNVLNYLKSINFHKRDHMCKKVPRTISLSKYSDTYPYASDFTITKLRPPAQFARKDFLQKRFDILKRDKQINVQILEDDLRSNILRIHSLANPKNVEISIRGGVGEAKKNSDRYYRSAIYDANGILDNTVKTIYNQYTFPPSISKIKLRDNPVSNIPNQKYTYVLSLLKTLENSGNLYSNSEPEPTNNDMYIKTLSKRNKWHNVKSYSNDYTPRKIDVNPLETNNNNVPDRHPAIRLKYKHEESKLVEEQDPAIIKGRKLAIEVSDQSNFNQDSVSLLKYNHGFLETRQKKHTGKNVEKNTGRYKQGSKSNFDKQVKLGNTLNEQFVIGHNVAETIKSFVGGNSKIPDIHRFKTELENEYGIDGSTASRVCKNVEPYDRVLYIQPDESIAMSHILSPLKAKNIGIEFIMQNYKKCSLTDSKLEINPKLYIDWSKTPVRLFGGARPKTTTDLCGFF